MKVTNKQVVEESLVLIQLLQEHTNTVDAAASFIRRFLPMNHLLNRLLKKNYEE